MNVSTIEMDPEQAQEKIAAWLRERHVDQEVVKEQCVKGYEALAAGKRLIQLDATIIAGGFFESGFPRLAVARADRRRCDFWRKDGDYEGCYDTRPGAGWWRKGRKGNLALKINFQQLLNRPPNASLYWHGLHGHSLVPLLPAEHRPATGQLSDWFILWEVERWVERPPAQPDRDPILLEHVAGQLFAVLAEWDLTELERAVMGGALRSDPMT